MKHLRVDKVFVEELKFKNGDKKKGKGFNRLVINKWKRSTFDRILAKYYKTYKVNAAYSSTIGNVLNPTLPDPVAASTEIARRGYRLTISKNGQFYPELPAKSYIEDRWKKPDVPDFKEWKELHDWLKLTGLKYRVDVGSSMFRTFESRRSCVFFV